VDFPQFAQFPHPCSRRAVRHEGPCSPVYLPKRKGREERLPRARCARPQTDRPARAASLEMGIGSGKDLRQSTWRSFQDEGKRVGSPLLIKTLLPNYQPLLLHILKRLIAEYLPKHVHKSLRICSNVATILNMRLDRGVSREGRHVGRAGAATASCARLALLLCRSGTPSLGFRTSATHY